MGAICSGKISPELKSLSVRVVHKGIHSSHLSTESLESFITFTTDQKEELLTKKTQWEEGKISTEAYYEALVRAIELMSNKNLPLQMRIAIAKEKMQCDLFLTHVSCDKVAEIWKGKLAGLHSDFWGKFEDRKQYAYDTILVAYLIAPTEDVCQKVVNLEAWYHEGLVPEAKFNEMFQIYTACITTDSPSYIRLFATGSGGANATGVTLSYPLQDQVILEQLEKCESRKDHGLITKDMYIDKVNELLSYSIKSREAETSVGDAAAVALRRNSSITSKEGEPSVHIGASVAAAAVSNSVRNSETEEERKNSPSSKRYVALVEVNEIEGVSQPCCS
jgi:hypothetical protein